MRFVGFYRLLLLLVFMIDKESETLLDCSVKRNINYFSVLGPSDLTLLSHFFTPSRQHIKVKNIREIKARLNTKYKIDELL